MKLYHLSKDKISVMIPRIPKSDYEDQKTPRICFAKSIQGCLIGINENKDIIGEVYHVYSLDTEDFYEPTKDEVADVHVTEEVWYTKKCEPKYEYDIKVIGKGLCKKEQINGKYFNVPTWKYKIIDTLDEKINNILNEKIHLDTILTKPFQLNKDITLYHYSDKKISVLKPIGMNAGNKLSRTPRKSIWLTEHSDEWILPILSYLKSNYRSVWGKELFWCAKAFRNNKNEDGTVKSGIILTYDFYRKHKEEIDNFKTYRYSKTLKVKEFGRGTEPTVPEWTYDSELKPDSVKMMTGKEFVEKGMIRLGNEVDILEEKDYRDSFKTAKTNDMVYAAMTGYKPEWWKYNPKTYKLKRKNAEEKYGVKSWLELHKK